MKLSCLLNLLIYNTLPGTTSAARVKADFLKEIITGKIQIEEITQTFALELLSHMKGGPSIEVLLDLSLGENKKTAKIKKLQVVVILLQND